MLARVEDKAGKVIVIVDDEMSFTELLGHLMGEHFHCPILTFSNPVAALDALSGLNVGIFVTDYHMPRRNGLDLIRTLGERMPTPPPCILITGHSLDEEEEPGNPVHFKAILPKPFRWQQLASLIEKHWPAGMGSPLREGVESLNG
jgi:CheY-like chemotaxis protein